MMIIWLQPKAAPSDLCFPKAKIAPLNHDAFFSFALNMSIAIGFIITIFLYTPHVVISSIHAIKVGAAAKPQDQKSEGAGRLFLLKVTVSQF